MASDGNDTRIEPTSQGIDDAGKRAQSPCPAEQKAVTSNRSSENRNAVIIFVKNPDPGEVKTRLAVDLGDATTMDVYLRLVSYTMEQAGRANADCFVYFIREIPEVWPESLSKGPQIIDSAKLRLQRGSDLGRRMEQAFREVFAAGYDRAVIIGSDCPELKTAHLDQALASLNIHDAVIGPARDGGYYLLGMRTLHSELFGNKQWSTESVFCETMRDLENAGLRTHVLQVLRDLDTLEDYQALKHLLPNRQLGDTSAIDRAKELPGQPGLKPDRKSEKVHGIISGHTTNPFISIIIPVYNEADGLASFLGKLHTILPVQQKDNQSRDAANKSGIISCDHSVNTAIFAESPTSEKPENSVNPNTADISCELILVDGGSTDNTACIAREAGVRCVKSPRKGRAAQMNYGARLAAGRILYFLHADTIPPPDALRKIVTAEGKGASSGCYRLSFDEPSTLMRFYAWFTRFDLLPFRYGDQSLFVRSHLFQRLGGYREDHIVMEDNEFIRRLRQEGSFVVLADNVVTSARKYRENGFLRLQFIFTLIFILYYLGAGQGTLVSLYRRLISNSKL